MSAAILDNELDAVDAFEDALREMKEQAERQYRELVHAMAKGKPVNPQVVREALLTAERSQADLRRHLAVARERMQANDNLAESAELTASIDGLAESCQSQRAEIDRLNREHAERMAPLRAALDADDSRLKTTRRRASELDREARHTLLRTQSPESRERFNVLSDRATRLRGQLNELKRRAQSLPEQIAGAEALVTARRSDVDRWAAQPASQLKSDGVARAQSELDSAKADVHRLQQLAGQLVNLEAETVGAEEALQRFLADEWIDWRNMRFD